MRRLAAAIACLACSCASAPDPLPVNAPVPASVGELTSAANVELGVDGEAIALAFSGGGARASAFSYGVLLHLRDARGADGRRLIDTVALVTAVSGGAVTAAWLGRHGPDGLDGFRAAALDKDWASRLRVSALAPTNWVRFLRGGVNGPEQLAQWLDREVYDGATMADLRPSPRIVLNATELFTGSPFAFTSVYFDAICSDLGGVRVADAVAASMAVPVVFRPVLLRTYAAECPRPPEAWVERAANDRAAPVMVRETARAFMRFRDAAAVRYLHLADGGVVDNFGLASLITVRRAAGEPYAPFSPRDAVRLKRLTVLVVNAELDIRADWPLSAKGPTGAQLVGASLDIAINANKRMSLEAFSAMLDQWERELSAWRCGLPADEAVDHGAQPGWRCDDVEMRLDVISFADLPDADHAKLGEMPTAVSLPRDSIDALIVGGREAARINPLIAELAADR